MDKKKERFPFVDEDGNVIGSELRERVQTMFYGKDEQGTNNSHSSDGLS